MAKDIHKALEMSGCEERSQPQSRTFWPRCGLMTAVASTVRQVPARRGTVLFPTSMPVDSPRSKMASGCEIERTRSAENAGRV